MLVPFFKNGSGTSMGSIRVPYYIVVGTCGRWRPSKKMRKLGFRDIACGTDGPTAWAIATECNKRVAVAA
jgi:hypothetical protein